MTPYHFILGFGVVLALQMSLKKIDTKKYPLTFVILFIYKLIVEICGGAYVVELMFRR